MPYYLAIGNLSLWEEAFTEALTDEDDLSNIGELIREIFEFGRYNLYCKFDEKKTVVAFNNLCDTLSRNKINHNLLNLDLDLGVW